MAAAVSVWLSGAEVVAGVEAGAGAGAGAGAEAGASSVGEDHSGNTAGVFTSGDANDPDASGERAVVALRRPVRVRVGVRVTVWPRARVGVRARVRVRPCGDLGSSA